MPKVAVPFRGVPDGETDVRDYQVGDEVTGDLARVAAAEGWLAKESAAVTAAAPVQQAADAIAIFIARVRSALHRAWIALRNHFAR